MQGNIPSRQPRSSEATLSGTHSELTAYSQRALKHTGQENCPMSPCGTEAKPALLYQWLTVSQSTFAKRRFPHNTRCPGQRGTTRGCILSAFLRTE